MKNAGYAHGNNSAPIESNTGRDLASKSLGAPNVKYTGRMQHVRECRRTGATALAPSAFAFVAVVLATACSVDLSKLRTRPAADSGAKVADAREDGVTEPDAADVDVAEVDALLDYPLGKDLGVEDSFAASGVDGVSAMPEVDDVAQAEDLVESDSDERVDQLMGTGGTFDTGGAGGAGGGGEGGVGEGGMAGVDGAAATGGTGGGFDAGGAGGADEGGVDGMAGIDGAAATGGTRGALPAGLVAWWKLDEAAGSGTAADASGNGNDATLTGLSSASAWTTGHTDGALKCDGSGGALVNHSASLDAITNGATVSAWVYRLSATTGFSVVLSRQIGTTSGEYYWLGLSGDYAAISSSASPMASTTKVPMATWTHLAVTHDGSTARIYVNGTQVLSRTSSAIFRADTSKLTICGNQNDASGAIIERWNGLVDDLQLYGRALTATEISSLAK